VGESGEDRLAALESVWYDVIEAVSAGRTSGLICPECQSPDGLQVEEQAGRVTLSCAHCQRSVEVQVNTA
jgi:hypothetical protein